MSKRISSRELHEQSLRTELTPVIKSLLNIKKTPPAKRNTGQHERLGQLERIYSQEYISFVKSSIRFLHKKYQEKYHQILNELDKLLHTDYWTNSQTPPKLPFLESVAYSE
jgi:hypothetical protein